ncbi:hypothetical protein [Pseudomonas fluorescens]|uniref:Uncharacterized protein n=1 Tax=Pseudomonas fluorescens TaxID=294 RepID=A0A5E7A5E4_PSEFL|nr:hypothetical protein [Pseudomonas fluorescens]VVN70853.1 hypothetical protein PS710_00415 [Pseudomonas fluorescens]
MSPQPVYRRRCYLVRHGHVDYFSPDGQPLDPRNVPLSGLGEDQVQASQHQTVMERIHAQLAPLTEQRP